ncbi:uncharacterized protein V1518DRAFT_376462 [Limtongia smithiae]|uniref:uncharacterized protein n=1 Tax=Limtongia smithiae TaxID=1125753 RepID=UPI0034CDE7C4
MRDDQENQRSVKRQKTQRLSPQCGAGEEKKPVVKKDMRAFAFRSTKANVSIVSPKDKGLAVKSSACLDNAVNINFTGAKKEATPLQNEVEKLRKLFTALDAALWMHHGGDVVRDVSSFNGVQAQVERASGRSFELTDLQRIMHLYPEAYTVSAMRAQTEDFAIEVGKADADSHAADFLERRTAAFARRCNDFLHNESTTATLPLKELPVRERQLTKTGAVQADERGAELKKSAQSVQLLLRYESASPSSRQGSAAIKAVTSKTALHSRQTSLLDRIRAKQQEREAARARANVGANVLSQQDRAELAALRRAVHRGGAIDVLLHLQLTASSSATSSTSMPLRTAATLVATGSGGGTGLQSVDDARAAIEVVSKVVPELCSVVQVREVCSLRIVSGTRTLCRRDIVARIEAREKEVLNKRGAASNSD